MAPKDASRNGTVVTAIARRRRQMVVWLSSTLLVVFGCGGMPQGVTDPPRRDESSTAQLPPLPSLGADVLIVAVPADAAPYVRLNDVSGLAEGWDVDLLTALGEKLDFDPEFVVMERDAAFETLAAGEIDLVGGGLSYSDADEVGAAFAAPYAIVKTRLIRRAADTRFVTFTDIREDSSVRVGGLTEERALLRAQRYFGQARVTAYDSADALIAALAASEIHAFALDAIRLQSVAAEGLRVLPGSLGADLRGYPVNADSQLALPLTLGLQNLDAEGTLQTLREKWGLDDRDP